MGWWKRTSESVRVIMAAFATFGLVIWLAAFSSFLDGNTSKGMGGVLIGLAVFFVAGWVGWRYSD